MATGFIMYNDYDMCARNITSTSKWIFLTYSASLLTFGTIGNVVLLVTLIYKRYCVKRVGSSRRRSSATLSISNVTTLNTQSYSGPRRQFSPADPLLSLLTCYQTACLWFFVFPQVLIYVINFDLTATNQSVCVIHRFLSRFCLNSSLVVMCVFSVYRAWSMKWPFSSTKWIDSKRLKVCMVGSHVFVLLKNLPSFWMVKVTETRQAKQCGLLSDQTRKTLVIFYHYTEMITHSIIGYTILAVCDALLYLTLRKTNRSVRKLKTDEKRSYRISSREAGPSLSRHTEGLLASQVILGISAMQVLLSTPYFVIVQLGQAIKLNLIPTRFEAPIKTSLQLLVFTNWGLNYWVILCISRQFRQQTCYVLRCFFNFISCGMCERIFTPKDTALTTTMAVSTVGQLITLSRLPLITAETTTKALCRAASLERMKSTGANGSKSHMSKPDRGQPKFSTTT